MKWRGRIADHGQQRGQGRDVLAMDLDERQGAGRATHLAVHMGVDRLDDRALARAARAPEQGIVGGQALGEAPGILDQRLLLPVDADQEIEVHAVDLGDRLEAVAGRMPDASFGRVDVSAGESGGARRSSAARNA